MERIPGLVFKGGTSLSKCYKIIDRFSEDIDLTLDVAHFTQKPKRGSIRSLIEVCEELGLELTNKEQVAHHTHANYNCLHISYPIRFPSPAIKSSLQVEMTYIQKCYPHQTKQVSSYIHDFLKGEGGEKAISLYELEPFSIQTQSLERTLVDKVFAICDYFLRGQTTRNSRHIYDISRLLPAIDLSDPGMKRLVKSVRIDRQPNKTALSAQPGMDVPMLLRQIVSTAYFRNDFERITSELLTVPEKYENLVPALQTIIESDLFQE